MNRFIEGVYFGAGLLCAYGILSIGLSLVEVFFKLQVVKILLSLGS